MADGTLTWSGQAGAANVLNVRAHMIVNDLEPSASKDGELRFGFRLVPTAKGKETVLQTSSYEERLLWTTTIDAVAHPDGTRHDAGIGRVVKVRRPERPAKLGIEIGSSSDFPCVVVLRLNGDLGTSGIYPGDCILAVNNTVVRTSVIAARVLGGDESELTLRLLGWNREVKMAKHAGMAGLVCCRPTNGPGMILSSVTKESPAAEAGLHVGDRILAVNNEVILSNDHEAAAKRIISATSDVRLTVVGVSVELLVRKDTNGRLGVIFSSATVPRGMQGAAISEAVPRGEAARGGVRVGDVLISVDDQVVTDGEHAMVLFKASARAMRIVIWRPFAPGAAVGGEGVSLVKPNRDESQDVFLVPGGKQPWAYYTKDVRHLGRSGLPIYEDITTTAALRT